MTHAGGGVERIPMKRILSILAGGMFIAQVFGLSAMVSAASDRIEQGKKVSLEYKLTVDGAVIDQSTPELPLQFVFGDGKILPSLEKALEGMKAGDEKKVTIEPKDAYGDVNPQAFVEYPKSRIPEGTPLEKGRVVDLVKDKSQIVEATIWEIQEENVLLNMNHPLAGKILDFDVKVVSIE